MSNGSFYGGRKGKSFIIIKSYPDIASMVLDFSKGGGFTEVNYDEYVIINTLNKNHPDNGKVFRRGYDYNSDRTISGYRAYDENDIEIIGGTEQQYRTARYEFDNEINAGGALYVGCIVGPAGNSPYLSLTTYNEVLEYYNKAPEDRKVISQGTISEEDLLPGKKADGTFNDDILWYSASIIKDNLDEGQAYIGFKVPYLVIDFVKKENTPYENVEISRIDDKSHPFYAQWEIGLPKGKHGNTIKNIKKIKAENYFSGDPTITGSLPKIYLDPTMTEPMTAQDFLDNGVTSEDDILVYEYWNYEESDPPETKICFLAPYKQVSNINVLEDGTVVISYTNENNDTFSKALSKITRLSYNDEEDAEAGLLRIEYNTGETLSIPIVYTDKLDLKENGILAFKKNVEQETVLDNPDEDHILGQLKWIKRVEYDDTAKKLRIYYNTEEVNSETQETENEKDEFDLEVVTDLKIEDNGQVKIRKGTKEWEPIYDEDSGELLPRVLRWITDIIYDTENDRMEIHYNTDTQGQPGEVIEHAFNKIVNVTFDEAVTFDDVTPPEVGPGFIITYSSGDTSKIRFSTGKLIKRIELIPGAGTTEGVVTTYTNSSLHITYTDNTTTDLEMDGKMVDNFAIVNGTPATAEDGSSIPTSYMRVTYDNTETQNLNTFLYPRSIIVENQTIDSSHKVKIYDSQGNKTYESNPINGISQININNNRLLVLYDNPTARDAIPEERAVQIDQGDGTTLRWDNLGVVRTDSGILVGKNIIPSQVEDPFSTEAEIIAYLNENFPNGQVIGSLYRIITVGEENQNKKFYGFDIQANTWYFLGTITGSAAQSDCIVGTIEEYQSATDPKKSQLNTGGLYFIIEES